MVEGTVRHLFIRREELPVSFAGDQDAESPPKGPYTHFFIDCGSGLCTRQGDCAHGIEWLPNVMLAPWFA